MEIVVLPMGEIHIGNRQRPADPKKVADLAGSIEQVGLLQPIGVVPDAGQTYTFYRLVFGLHRMQAVQMLEWTEIPAYVLPPDLAEEEYLLIELQENSARNDLTGAQRKAFAAEIGRLITILGRDSHAPNGNTQWFIEMGKRTGTPQTTMYRWWQEFCEAEAITLTPRQALAPHRERFFTWLEEHQREAEAEKQRKAAAAAEAERTQYLEDLHAEIVEAIGLYGWDVVYTTVLVPVLEGYLP